MIITTVQPKTSKVTGGVIVDIAGQDFLEDQLVLSANALNFSDTSTSLSSATFTLDEKVILSLPEAINQKASIKYTDNIPPAFFFELSYSTTVRSFPLLHKSKGLGIEIVNQVDTTKKYRIYIQYENFYGYSIAIESWDGLLLLEKEQMPIDHRDIETIGLEGCGKYIHGLVKIGGEYIRFGKSLEIANLDNYSLEIFSESPNTGTGRESEIIINSIHFNNMVSFAGYPTDIISWTDSFIKVKTLPGEVSLGDLIVVLKSGEYQVLEDEVRYALGNDSSRISKSFDCVQAIYNEYVNPSREKLFLNNEGFKWDEDYFLSENNQNNNLSVPTLWDPSTGNIPRSFFQSGVGPFQSLEFKGIEKVISEDNEKWYAKINHGTYFVSNVPYYLFSDESVIQYLGELKTEDGRSYQPLLYKPKVGIPIVAASLGEDSETKRIIERERFQKKGKFTGKVLNGVELDSSNPDNIDNTKKEFIVKYNSNNQIINWKVPVEDTLVGSYFFDLPRIPLKDFKVIFSRKDIFKKERTIAKKYGEDTYDSFQYGDGIEDIGDYAIDYGRGTVEVLLDRPYKDLGFVTFTFDYPAIIEFNSDYTAEKGISITNPTFNDLNNLDKLGISNGQPGQRFRLFDFPVIDYSSQTIIDNSSFKIFIYDEYDNSFDTEWTRVFSFENSGPNDKVFILNSEIGEVIFGNGIKGKIPNKYLNILAAYKPTLKIQFEPESSNDYWSGKTIDLNLTKQNLSSGFLFLSRTDLIPSYIELEFASSNILAFETTELNGRVFTQDGDIVPFIPVHFEIMNGGGFLRDETLISNSNGEVSTIYTPSPRLQDLGIRIDLFEPGVDEETHGDAITDTYGTEAGIPYLSLKAEEIIQGDIEEMYLFKILDDGDDFLPYNNLTREGGRLVVYNDGSKPIKGLYVAGSVMAFSDQLPQPFDENAPNYEPNLRGFYIVGKKTIQARAYIDTADIRIYSDIVGLTVEYSPLQKGTWRLPIPPIDFESSQINTATYINID